MPKDYVQLLLQPLGMVEKGLQGFLAILESLNMGDEPASLNRKEEVSGSPLIPFLKGLSIWKAVEGDVQFDRIKELAIELKPPLLGQGAGIEYVIPPMLITISACSDKNPWHLYDPCGVPLALKPRAITPKSPGTSRAR